jgi:hypothetical protein
MKTDVLHDVGADEFNYRFSSFFSLEVRKNNWFLPSHFFSVWPTPKSAPTKEARSILLITNKSDLVIPGLLVVR